MGAWIILTIVLLLPAFLIVAACMNSSRLSRAEEVWFHGRADSQTN
jgi:hypothetical protein